MKQVLNDFQVQRISNFSYNIAIYNGIIDPYHHSIRKNTQAIALSYLVSTIDEELDRTIPIHYIVEPIIKALDIEMFPIESDPN